MGKEKLLECNGLDRVTYTSLVNCQERYQDCVEIPKDFKCETWSEKDGKLSLDSDKKVLFDDAEDFKKFTDKNEREEATNRLKATTNQDIKDLLRLLKDKIK